MSGPVTGVGSLPHANAAEAAAFVLATTDIPYLPQLPARHPAESMLRQWGEGLAGMGGSRDGIGLARGAPVTDWGERFGGARATAQALPSDTPIVKTQATGPVTLAMALRAAGYPGTDLWQTVTEGLAAQVKTHVDWLRGRHPGTEVALVFDEPALAGIGDPGFPVAPARAEQALGEALRRAPVPAGIHCCADTDWAMVARLRPAYLSWDVKTLGPGFAAGSEALASAIADGSRPIWGVAPVGPPPLPEIDALVARYKEAEGILLVAGAPADRLDQAWFSPGCGLAGVGVDHAEAVAALVRRIAGEVHARR